MKSSSPKLADGPRALRVQRPPRAPSHPSPPSPPDPLVPAPPPYPIPIHPRNLLFVLTVNVVSALWNSLISQILPNNFRVTRHWIAFPRPVITKIPDASVSSSPSGGGWWHFQWGSKNFPRVSHMFKMMLHEITHTFFFFAYLLKNRKCQALNIYIYIIINRIILEKSYYGVIKWYP